MEATIRSLEERLLMPEVRGSREALEELLAEDFFEIGRSGRTYGRGAIVAELAAEEPFECSLEGFSVKRLGDDVVLATYTSHAQRADGTKSALRSSIWIRRDERWQLVYHQGTAKA